MRASRPLEGHWSIRVERTDTLGRDVECDGDRDDSNGLLWKAASNRDWDDLSKAGFTVDSRWRRWKGFIWEVICTRDTCTTDGADDRNNVLLLEHRTAVRVRFKSQVDLSIRSPPVTALLTVLAFSRPFYFDSMFQ